MERVSLSCSVRPQGSRLPFIAKDPVVQQRKLERSVQAGTITNTQRCYPATWPYGGGLLPKEVIYGQQDPHHMGSHEGQGLQPPRILVFLRRRRGCRRAR